MWIVDACLETVFSMSCILLVGIVGGSCFLTGRSYILSVLSRRRKEGQAMDKSKKGGDA